MLFGRLDRVVVVPVIFRVLFVVKLMRDLAGFRIDKICRQIELHHPVKLVEERALQHRTCGTLVLRLKTFRDLDLQRGQILGSELLGQLIVDLGRLRLFYGLDSAGENRGFARQMLGPIGLGKAYVDRQIIADLGTDQLRLKARNERVGAQNERIILARATLEQLSVDRALEVDHHLIAVLGLGTLLAVVKILGRPRKVLQRLVNSLVFGLHDQPLQSDLAGVDLRDRGQHVIGHLNHDILALFPSVASDHLDFGLHGGPVTGPVEVILHGAVDGFLHGVADNAGTQLPFQDRQWHLAFAEPLDLDLGLRFQKLALDLCVQFRRRHRDGVTALEAFVQGLGDLHAEVSFLSRLGCNCTIETVSPGHRPTQVCAPSSKGFAGR